MITLFKNSNKLLTKYKFQNRLFFNNTIYPFSSIKNLTNIRLNNLMMSIPCKSISNSNICVNDKIKQLELAKYDVTMALFLLKEYTDSNIIFNIDKIILLFELISNNLYQFEFKAEEKINTLLNCFLQIIKKLNSPTQNLIFNNEFSIKILNKLINSKHFKFYKAESSVTSILIINLISGMDIKNKLNSFNELKFLIQYGISNESKMYKLFKYGKYIFKDAIRNKEKLFYRIFINLSCLDNSNLPVKIEVEEEYVPYLIYSNYLDVINNNSKIEDYINLLDRYILILEKDYNNKAIQVTTDEIEARLKVLESTIHLLSKKKEHAVIKLVSDILLAYFREYKEKLNLNHMVILFSIISHDNFINLYDIELFKEDLIPVLQKLLLSLSEDQNDNFDLLVSIDLLSSIDKLFCIDEKKPLDIINKITNLVRKKDSSYANLIDCVFNCNNIKFAKNVSEQLFNSNITIPSLIEGIDKSKNILIDKYKLILQMKLMIRSNIESNTNSDDINYIKTNLI